MNPSLENNGLSLESVEEKFHSWRSTRKRGERIPASLWEMAVSLAERYSVEIISQTLHLSWAIFQKRLCQKKGIPYNAAIAKASGWGPESSASPFIELKISKNTKTSPCGSLSPSPWATGGSSPCIVELINPSGGILKIYSPAVEQLDINLNLLIERFLSPNSSV